MNRSFHIAWLLALVALSIAGWAVLGAAGFDGGDFSLLVYALANLIVFSDAFDFAVRAVLRRRRPQLASAGAEGGSCVSVELPALPSLQPRSITRPYAILVSVHNLAAHFDEFVEAMHPYRDRIWVIDDASTDETALRLRHLGWRCLEGGINRKKPGAIRALVASLPPEIESVMVVDPDIRLRAPDGGPAPLERVVADFQRSKMAALCPRLAIRKDGLLGRFQSLEYSLAFDLGRRGLADHCITSGIALYRRSDLAEVLARHSQSVYAEDLENTLLLLGRGGRIYYDGRLVAETHAMDTWRHWFSQRVGWHFGLLKVYFERSRELRRVAALGTCAVYQFIVYTGLFALLLYPLKLASGALLLVSLANGIDGLVGLDAIPDTALTNPFYAASACFKYTLLSLVASFMVLPKRDGDYVRPIVPLYLFYVLAHLAPMGVGYANWFAVRLRGRRLYRDHYDVDAPAMR